MKYASKMGDSASQQICDLKQAPIATAVEMTLAMVVEKTFETDTLAAIVTAVARLLGQTWLSKWPSRQLS